MRVLVQRVNNAGVSIDNKEYSSIGPGYLIYVGFTQTDTFEIVKKCAEKIINLRIFEDESGKMNLALPDVSGKILLVSQFTLYGDTKGNNRPSFTKSAGKDIALPLYEYLISCLNEKIVTKTGVFGADMVVKSDNSGPITIIIEI